ncbi:MAG: hypothetical protein SGARI_007422, partial [Bacillariaceae sp.]
MAMLQQAQQVVQQPSHMFDNFDLDIEPTPIGPTANIEDTPLSVPSSSSCFYQTNALPPQGLSSYFSPQFVGSSVTPQQVTSQPPIKQADTMEATKRSRKFQTGQWNERFQELLAFRAKHGHLFVPHHYPENQQLAQWVKRQRYQYKLKHQMGKHSTLSDDRQEALQNAGF